MTVIVLPTPSQSVNSRKHRILMSAHVVLSDLFTAHPTGSGTIAMCCCGSVTTRAWHPPTAIVNNNNQPANRCNGKLRQLARHLACTAWRQHQSLCDATVPLFTSGYIHRAVCAAVRMTTLEKKVQYKRVPAVLLLLLPTFRCCSCQNRPTV